MKLLPTASLSNQQKTSCSAMGFVDSVICEGWAAQTQGILQKILWVWAGHQHKHFQLCFYTENGKEEGNKCNRRSRRAERDSSTGDRKQFITYLRVFSESSVLQLRQQCRSVRLYYTQTHKHTNIPSCLEPPLSSWAVGMLQRAAFVVICSCA